MVEDGLDESLDIGYAFEQKITENWKKQNCKVETVEEIEKLKI